jgi:hypothetical protein
MCKYEYWYNKVKDIEMQSIFFSLFGKRALRKDIMLCIISWFLMLILSLSYVFTSENLCIMILWGIVLIAVCFQTIVLFKWKKYHLNISRIYTHTKIKEGASLIIETKSDYIKIIGDDGEIYLTSRRDRNISGKVCITGVGTLETEEMFFLSIKPFRVPFCYIDKKLISDSEINNIRSTLKKVCRKNYY